MERFYIQEVINETIEFVGEGVKFATGKVVIQWFDDGKSLTFFDTIDIVYNQYPNFNYMTLDPTMTDLTKYIN